MAFAHLEDAIVLAQDLVCAVVARVLETRKEELKTLERDTSKLENVRAPFPRLHYDDAIKLIQAKGSQTPWGSDFGGTDETVIAENYDRPVVVHRFPAQVKAFYMATDPERPEISLSADILAPEGYGEIVGGGERLSDGDALLKKIHEHGLPEESFRWYLDLRRYGSVPHAGIGVWALLSAASSLLIILAMGQVIAYVPGTVVGGFSSDAGRDLDLRPGAPARDHRLPADAVPDLPLIVAYVSGHGYGHATRVGEVLRAVRAIEPRPRLTVVTSGPERLYRQAVPGPFALRSLQCDVGLVQKGALVMDEAATVDAWRAFVAGDNARIAAEARWLGEVGARVVLGDIPPLAFTAAASDQMRSAHDGLVALSAMAAARKNVEVTSERKTKRLAMPAKPLRRSGDARSVMAVLLLEVAHDDDSSRREL